LSQHYPGNPAVDFLKQPFTGSPEQLIQQYARFLLQKAGAYQLPVLLERVHRYFNVSVQHRFLLEQHGLTTEDLRIFLNAADRPTVQKFTLAHELIEILFFALKDGAADEWMSDEVFTILCEDKERFCNRGAAELIMPLPHFQELVTEQSMSLQWAQEVATRCQVSLTATIWRIIETQLASVVLIFWRYKHRPNDFVPSKVGQWNLFGPPEEMDPPKKMRVEMSYAPPGSPYIPADKSVPEESSIHQTFLSGKPTSAFEDLDLVGFKGRFFVESRPLTVDRERQVMSLLHLDK
jgi:hypothetical protein